MKPLIPLKNMMKATTVDMRTGEETPSNGMGFMLPSKPGTCDECAVDHGPNDPHNKDSLHYQYYFYNIHGRWPTWIDAMGHCPKAVQQHWKKALQEKGVKLK